MMDAEFLQGFLAQAEGSLPSIRRGIVASAGTGNVFGELSDSLRRTVSIRDAATIVELTDAAALAGKLEEKLRVFADLKTVLTEEQTRGLLDKLGELESLLAEVSRRRNDFSTAAFGGDAEDEDESAEQFELDAETLKIFAEEAEDLIARIQANLETLEKNAEDADALLEIRRAAHTLKGSAGVVGLRMLADVAHRVEDLLDYLADSRTPTAGVYFEILCAAADCFGRLAASENSPPLAKKINRLYEHFDWLAATLPIRGNLAAGERSAEAFAAPAAKTGAAENAHARRAVRVEVAKLDDLDETFSRLTASRDDFQTLLGEFAAGDERREKLAALYENQNRVIEELRRQLPRLRLLRFGSLTARLQRAARAACEETGNTAELFIENEHLEIDAAMLDALIEPLAQMLRNAVAHGIEPPETRRAHGKPETGRIEIAVASEESTLTVRVADDGRGIIAAALRRRAVRNGILTETEAGALDDSEIFDLIYLAGITTAETIAPAAGRGVGMNIVKAAVERLGGAIRVESQATRGTTFTIRLPLPTTEKTFAESRDAPAVASLSVMIVDDSRSVRRDVARLVEDAGWTAVAARDGLEALDVLQDADALPDVILSDVEMPRINGLELLTTIKERETLRRIPVVMMTARAAFETREKAFAAGAADYFVKPFDDRNLIEKIKTLVG